MTADGRVDGSEGSRIVGDFQVGDTLEFRLVGLGGRGSGLNVRVQLVAFRDHMNAMLVKLKKWEQYIAPSSDVYEWPSFSIVMDEATSDLKMFASAKGAGEGEYRLLVKCSRLIS